MIVRVLLHDTPILLLDEPTSFLDYENKEWLFGYLKKLCEEKRKLVFVASHDLDTISKYESRRIKLEAY